MRLDEGPGGAEKKKSLFVLLEHRRTNTRTSAGPLLSINLPACVHRAFTYC